MTEPTDLTREVFAKMFPGIDPHAAHLTVAHLSLLAAEYEARGYAGVAEALLAAVEAIDEAEAESWWRSSSPESSA